MLKYWLSSFVSGLRLMLGVPVGRQQFERSLPFLLSALAVSLALFAGFDYFLLDNIRFQDIRGSAFLGFFIGLAALLAIVAAHLENDYPQLPVLLGVLLSCLPWAAVLLSLFPYDWAISNEAGWLLTLLLAYCAFVVVRCLTVAFYRPRIRTVLVTVTGLVLVSLHSWDRFYFPAVFDSYNTLEYDQGPTVDIEYILYQQLKLVDEQLSQVAPSPADTADFFFLGFGGSDHQTVFESETLFAQNLMATLYATGDRSLVLYNNVDKLDEQPIANTYNIIHAIEGMGQKMGREEDVLIMLLTSHGSEDATLAVDLEYLNLKTLNADDLKNALDFAGIKWRIIIISACYSGSFIDTLENENTLLITASSAERNSFGCSSDRELTVFGEALFKYALNGDTNWVSAFVEAEKLVRTWETKAEVPHSNPQIRVGHNIRLKLGLPVPPAPTIEPESALE